MLSFRDKVRAANDELKRLEPKNIETDHQGRTGYKPQAVIDAMNLAFDAWGFDEISSEIIDDGNPNNVKVVAQVRVWICDSSGDKLPFTPSAWGEGNQFTPSNGKSPDAPINLRIGDARKSAQTDALKKALSYFSVGNRAYWGELKGSPPKGNSYNGR